MKQNIVMLGENIARAFEIARGGGHSLSIVPGDTDNDRQMKDNCNFLRQQYAAGDDYASDIVVELHNIDRQSIIRSYSTSSYETLEHINQRIEHYRNNSPSVDLSLSGPVLKILESAIDKLSLSVVQVQSIISVSKTIAGMGGSNLVKVEHIAEAIQYQSAEPK